LVTDPHVVSRGMLVEVTRTDGVEQPVLVPGNPVKLSQVPDGADGRVPWLGEHTDDVLGHELHLSPAELSSLRSDGVIF
jgi:crotonobetainyl-CoA:carnitine CoA-transferase CaiB-like acyl-CoA transferase